MNSAAPTEAATPPEDPALRFIRRELAPSPERWIAALAFTALAMIGVLATVTFRIPYPVLVFAGILLLTVPPPQRPLRQATEATGGALVGAGFAVLLAITTYDQPWFYLPLQCAALAVLLVLSRVTAARAGFILRRWSCPSPSPPTCPIRRRQSTPRCSMRWHLSGRHGLSLWPKSGSRRRCLLLRRRHRPDQENSSASRCSR